MKKIIIFLIIIIVVILSIAGVTIYKYNTSELVSIIQHDYSYSTDSFFVPQVMSQYTCVKRNGTVYYGYTSHNNEKVKRLKFQELNQLKEKLKNFQENVEENNSKKAVNRITINGITYGGTPEIDSTINEIINFLKNNKN